ncbi:hypothetical protein BASA81_008268 [Batrachochytrium salamandrivorans]|nr:hypothetical protein BASA81_008268 [Batrachochytrium salamandrivorans]
MGLVLGMTEFAAIPAGFLGFVGDRIGSKWLTAISYLFLCICSALMLLPPVFGVLLVIRFFFGFFRDLSMLAIQDYCCRFFPKERQDMVTAVLELSYGISALIGVPLLGLAYDAYDWTAPFIIMAVLLFSLLPVVLYVLYKYTGTSYSEEEGKLQEEDNKPRLGYLSGLQYRNGALAFNLSGLFLNIGANLLATEFGIVLAEVYKLDEAKAGAASLALSFGEVVGVLAAMSPCIGAFSFRTMRVSGVLAFVLSVPFVIWGVASFEATLGLLFVLFAFVEFCTVQRFSRASQFAGAADAIAMLGVNVQFQYAGRTIGASIAGVMFVNAGHVAVAVLACLSFLLAVLFTELAVRQKPDTTQQVGIEQGEQNEVTII